MSISGSSNRAVGVHFDGDAREAMVVEATALIAERGVEALSLREVARRVGVSHAAPAHHFGDKAGLLTAVATVGFNHFTEYMAQAVLTARSKPVDILLAMGEAYSQFAAQQAGYFDVMFHPSLIRDDDPDYLVASDAAFDALRLTIESCQHNGWHPLDDTLALTTAAWSLAHGIAVLRRQGSLQRHFPDSSVGAVSIIAATLLDD